MANAYDFTIDTLDFRCATSKQTPYVRSTAPFRKEQFDSSQAAGDQSLTGWWTRGQFSFHKGDGIRYYEVSDGEAVLNRSAETNRVTVSIPGEVALAWNGVGDPQQSYEDFNITSPADVLAAKPASLVFVGGSTYVTLAGGQGNASFSYDADTFAINGLRVVRLANGSQGNLTTTTTGSPQSVATHSGIVYVAVGNAIEKYDTGVSGWTTTPSTVLWTNTNAGTKYDTFISIWWAKDRIFAVDGGGNWYALDPSGGTIPAGGGSYLFWASGSRGRNWCFAESVGPVYISQGRYIRSLTVDTGTSATLGTPTIVGDLGPGEGVAGMAVNGAYLGILTNSNFRLAAIDSSGGLTIGPTILPYQYKAPPNSGAGDWVAAIGDVFYVLGGHVDVERPASVWRVSTVDFIDTLQPAVNLQVKAPLSAPGGNGFSAYGAIVAVESSFDPIYGRMYPCYLYVTYGATNAYYDSNVQQLSPTGYVKTGYHRFGTLDQKRFYSVTVRAKGTGTVEVWQLNPEESGVADIKLGTLDVTQGRGEYLFQYPAGSAIEGGALERLALKFVLNRPTGGDYYGPTFLGYQIKALPSPQRQRLLKVPLVIADRVETRWKRDTGKAGRAWSDLQKLEALESSKAIVPFTDHRTGETGSAYIDSIDFQGEVPTDGASSNFGGVAYATLRVVGS